MMTFWLDIMTPKQVWLFESIKRNLEAKGHKVVVTTRVHDVVIELLNLKKMTYYVAGKHGGETLEGKLKASAERMLELVDYVSPFFKEVDFSINLSSPEAGRVAFGLGIKNICLNDAPHSTSVAKLTFPLSKHVVSPAYIAKRKLIALGASREAIVQYDGVDEVAWILNAKLDPSVLNTLHLDKSKPIVVIRPEESKAAYLQGFKDINVSSLMATALIKRILLDFPTTQIVVIPRYEEQRIAIKNEFNGKVTVPDHAVDGPSLLAFSTLSISGGGTMDRESALLGVPSICHFQITLDVERYLFKKGFPIYHSKNMDEVTSHALAVLRDPDKYRVDTRKLTRNMESPLDAINWILREYESK